MIHFLFDWLGYWIVRGAAFIIQRQPLDRALGLGRMLGGLGYALFRKKARIALHLKKLTKPR